MFLLKQRQVPPTLVKKYLFLDWILVIVIQVPATLVDITFLLCSVQFRVKNCTYCAHARQVANSNWTANNTFQTEITNQRKFVTRLLTPTCFVHSFILAYNVFNRRIFFISFLKCYVWSIFAYLVYLPKPDLNYQGCLSLIEFKFR